MHDTSPTAKKSSPSPRTPRVRSIPTLSAGPYDAAGGAQTLKETLIRLATAPCQVTAHWAGVKSDCLCPCHQAAR